jgi:hypothetical protein
MQATSDIPISTRKESAPAVNRSSRAFILASFAVAIAAFIAAPLLAIQWSRQLFPGFLVEQTLVVQPVVNPDWSGVQAGVAYPQRIVRAAAQPIASARDLNAILGPPREAGDKILVFARFPDGTQEILPPIELNRFPPSDMWRLFWLPYLVGAVYLGIGGWIYRLRGNTRPGATLALFCTVTALTCALIFDTMTTHVMTVIWSVAVALVGGSLIELALRFPEEWSEVTRRPWLSFVPFLVSLGLAAWAVLAFLFPANPWTYLIPRAAGFRYASIGIVVFIAVMLYRARQGSSLLVRRQARLVTIGGIIAFTPVMIWLVLPLFGVSVDFDPALFLPPLLVFPIAVGLAILRYRLWEVDSFVNHAFVYGLLTAILAGVFAAMIAFTQRMFLAVTGQQSDIAVVITTLIVAATFTPLKSTIEGLVARQFRNTYDQTRDLRAYGDQVQAFLTLSDPQLITRRLLEDAVRSLKAQSGTVFLITDGQLQHVHSVGPWKNNPRLGVNLECGRHRHGVLLLGPPQAEQTYDRQEAEILQQVANQVAKAVCIAQHNHDPSPDLQEVGRQLSA